MTVPVVGSALLLETATTQPSSPPAAMVRISVNDGLASKLRSASVTGVTLTQLKAFAPVFFRISKAVDGSFGLSSRDPGIIFTSEVAEEVDCVPLVSTVGAPLVGA